MELYIYLEEHNIIIENLKTKIENLKGVYLKISNIDIIGINYSKIKSYIEKRCVLAHEIGHYESGTMHTSNIDDVELSRIEYRADKRAIHKLIPRDKLKAFIERCRPNYIYEIAEEFDITELYVQKALELYK